jgi:hypothetical protein
VSWCDKLASTPTVGIRLTQHFAPVDLMTNALSPILDRAAGRDTAKFTLEKYEIFKLEFNTEEGFKYAVDPARVSVGFNHRFKVKPTSAGLPVMEIISRARPFTELLPTVSDKLLEAAMLLPGVQARKLTQVGIVATTTVTEDDLPPGVRRFIEYLGRPWKGKLDQFNVRVNAIVDETSEWSDRCMHVIVNPPETDEEQLLTLQFDWHRKFLVEQTFSASSLGDTLKAAQKSALAYFESVGEGTRFDEEILRGGGP